MDSRVVRSGAREEPPDATGAAPHPHHERAARPWLAMLLMSGAMLCFTTLDTLMRSLYVEHPLPMLIFIRNLVQAAGLSLLIPVFGRRSVRTGRIGIHVMRGACMVLTTVFIILALAHLPMAQAYSITFSTPLMATVIAAVALGERPGPAQWICVGTGLLGVVIVLDPRGFTLGAALLYPLAMAFFNACLFVLTRYAGRSEGPYTLVFWASLAAVTFCLLGLPFYAVPLPLTAYALLIVGGTLGTLAHLMIAGAFRLAPTVTVAPMLYTQIIWASLVGWLVFEEVPALHVVIGSAVIIASGVLLLRAGAPARR